MEHSPEMYYSYILVISHYISNTTHIYDLIYPTYENMKYAKWNRKYNIPMTMKLNQAIVTRKFQIMKLKQDNLAQACVVSIYLCTYY